MSNKKRIAKKVQQLEAFSFRRKFKIAVFQMIKFIELAKLAKIASQPRKQYPSGVWNELPNSKMPFVFKNADGVIIDSQAMEKAMAESWNEYLKGRSTEI